MKKSKIQNPKSKIGHYLQTLCLVIGVHLCPFLPPDAGAEEFHLTIAHLADTHGHLDASPIEITCGGVKTTVHAGGFPLIAETLHRLRKDHPNLLFLHAGDVFQGTLYFTRYKGEADAELLNWMLLDGLCPGNHEFDKGIAVFEDFICAAKFPVVAANMDTVRERALHDTIHPYIVKHLGNHTVGIIGLAYPDTAILSNPGNTVHFNDPVPATRQAIIELGRQRVNKIVVLSHCGFERDIALAREVEGIDVIIGGHSHTLLGKFEEIGLPVEGEYPAVVQSPRGETVLVAHAGEWAKVLGILDVVFNDNGTIISHTGAPFMPVAQGGGRTKGKGSAEGFKSNQDTVLACARSRCGCLDVLEDDTTAARILKHYAEPLQTLYATRIAEVYEDLLHVRKPDPKKGIQSDIAPLVADALLWRARQSGFPADIAVLNAGSLSGGLTKGDLSEGRVYDLLPYTNALVMMTLTGAELRDILAYGVRRAYAKGSRGGMFPYGAGISYTIRFRHGRHARVTDIAVKNNDGSWQCLRSDRNYRVIINEYMARGGDGYAMIMRNSGERVATGLIDVDAFKDYARQSGRLRKVREQRIRIVADE